MNLSDTARLRTLTLQRAVVYDGDAQRAERVAEVLRTLGLEPLLIDHSALMRAVIQAVVLDGLSARETAQLLNVPVSSVKTRLFRAKAHLRATLAEGVS